MKLLASAAGGLLLVLTSIASAQTTSATAKAVKDGQATSSTRPPHIRHHKSHTSADGQVLPSSNAKDAHPPGSGPTSGQ